MDEEQQDQIVVGRVSGAHGIKGWVKVYSYTDPMEQILEYSPWQVSKGGKIQSLEIQSGKRQGKGLVALLEGFEDRSQAELIAGAEISIPRARLPALEPGEYYWYQLEGLSVVNDKGECLGVVDHMLETGSNDVMSVKPTTGSIDTAERLVPFVEGVTVTEVDLEQGRILVVWDADF